VINEEPIHVGELVLTSGEDKIFPKDLLIGTVSVATQGNPFQTIHIKPAARLDRLEDVIILLSPQEMKRPESADAAAPGASPNSPGVVRKEPATAAKPTGLSTGAASPANASQPANAPNPAPKN